MTTSVGEEFKIKAAPNQALLRKLAYLATQGSDTILSGHVKTSRKFTGDTDNHEDGRYLNALQMISIADQEYEHRIRLMEERLNNLERITFEKLALAQQRLEEIKQNANRTLDGHLVFEAEDGTFRGEDGLEINPDKIDFSKWNPDAPTFSEFTNAQKQYDEAIQFRDNVIEHKEQLASGELSVEELDDLESEIANLESTISDVPTTVNSNSKHETQKHSASAAKNYTDDQVLCAGFDLNKNFSNAIEGNHYKQEDQPVTQEPDRLPIPNQNI